MAAIINQDDSAVIIADQIWKEMEILQSCKVLGFEFDTARKCHEKGQLVIDYLREMDRKECTHYSDSNKKTMRKNKRPPNSIGGYLAQKIFCWQRVITNEEPKFTIWRIQ